MNVVTLKGHLTVLWKRMGMRIMCLQVDYEAQKADGKEEEAFDGVAVFSHVHNQYISALAWVCDPSAAESSSITNHLLSASYDGTIRLLDVHKVGHKGMGVGTSWMHGSCDFSNRIYNLYTIYIQSIVVCLLCF